MTVASDNADELSAAQLERHRRAVSKVLREAMLEVIAEPPITLAEAVARFRDTVKDFD